MSYLDPTPEERNRIVADALSKVQKLAPENELEALMRKAKAADDAVRSMLTPIYDVELMSNRIHSPKGRQAFKLTALKLYLDMLKDLDRDEALWLMALVRAEIMCAQFV